MTGATGHSVSSKSRLMTRGVITPRLYLAPATMRAGQSGRDGMMVDRISAVLLAVCLGSCNLSRAATTDASQAFGVRDLVRLERMSDLAVSSDGKRVAYTLRSTDMDANKGRTAIWVYDTQKRNAIPVRLTDLAANASTAEW